MPGVGDLQVLAPGYGVGDLAAQVRRRHDVVGETEHQHRRGDVAVGGQLVALRRDPALADHPRGELDRPDGEHADPLGDGLVVAQRLGRKALQQPDLRVVGERQLHTGGGELVLGGAEELARPVQPAAGGHQHRLGHQIGPGHHQLLGDERTHRHRDDAHRADAQRLDQRRGVGDHALGGETVGARRRAHPAVVEGDDAVAGLQERRDLMQMPGASRTAAAGDEQDGLPGPVVVVSQVDHDDEPTRQRRLAVSGSPPRRPGSGFARLSGNAWHSSH